MRFSKLPPGSRQVFLRKTFASIDGFTVGVLEHDGLIGSRRIDRPKENIESALNYMEEQLITCWNVEDLEVFSAILDRNAKDAARGPSTSPATSGVGSDGDTP